MEKYYGLKDKGGNPVCLILDENYYKHPHEILQVERIQPIEIIPDRKELPKSKEELIELYNEYCSPESNGMSFRDFLDEEGY